MIEISRTTCLFTAFGHTLSFFQMAYVRLLHPNAYAQTIW
jgi:hypothetical protein